MININDIPNHILAAAYEQIGSSLYPEDFATWEEDTWFSLGDSWDLNLHLGENGKKLADLYRVEDGKTQTEEWFSLAFSDYEYPPVENEIRIPLQYAGNLFQVGISVEPDPAHDQHMLVIQYPGGRLHLFFDEDYLCVENTSDIVTEIDETSRVL